MDMVSFSMDAKFIHGSLYLLVDPVIRRHGGQSTIGRGLIPWLKVRLQIANWGIDNPWISFYPRAASRFFSMSRGEMKSDPSATPPKFVKTPANLYKPTSYGFDSKNYMQLDISLYYR